MEKLRRELEEKMAEVMRIKGTLQSSELVSVHLKDVKLIHHHLAFRAV